MSSTEISSKNKRHKGQITRAYALNHFANSNKVMEIILLHREYIKAAKQFRKHLIQQMMMGVKLTHFDSFYKEVKSPLSKRYLQVCQRQIVGMFKSWQSNFLNDINHMIKRSILDKNDRARILQIHDFQIYQISNILSLIKGKNLPISEEDIILYKAIRRRILKRRSFPRVDNINIQTSTLVTEIKPGKCSSFPYWVKISTLQPGKKIQIPLQSNSYFEGAKGKISNSCNIIVKNNKIQFYLVKNFSPEYKPSEEIVSMDFGIRTLFSTHFGDQFGQKFKKILYEYDKKITRLAANLQRQKINPNQSKRYRKLIAKIRNYLKNEINRCLNAIIKNFTPKELVVESLDFRGSNLSKRLNRIISKCGRKFIRLKFELFKKMGINITQINPMYTSQECSRCHIIDKKNRNNKKYKCQNCGLFLDADVNGARNIFIRRSSDFFRHYMSKQETRQFLEERFINFSKKELVRKERPHSWSRSSLIRPTA